MNTKLDVDLSELTIISCALNDYYFSQIARYKSSEYYEVVEIKKLLDTVAVSYTHLTLPTTNSV